MRFPFETLAKRRIRGEVRVQELDGNGAVVAAVRALVDRAHATAAQK
jgi:hypothetical protein